MVAKKESSRKKIKTSHGDSDTVVVAIGTADILQATSVEQVRALQAQLLQLAQQAEKRLVTLQAQKAPDFTDGCFTKLIDSNQSQDQDIGNNMCSRSITAQFTTGPNAKPFSISLSVANWEGDEEIDIDSELFDISKDVNDEIEDCFGMPTQEEIDGFLLQAGLGKAPLTRLCPKNDNKNNSAEICRRFAYGEIINEALKLVAEKHGWEDNCGVGLGLGNEHIYSLLGLEY